MKIKDYKCKDCGCKDFFLMENKQHKGIYCKTCGLWYKWANKNEVNLFKKEVSEDV